MANEMNAPCQKEMKNGPGQQSDKAIITSAAGVKVMVVDDDVVCLSIVSGILRTWKYQVVTVRNAVEALSTLRAVNNFFNLVLTDVHMPEMDGYEFQRRVHEELNLPVVMMSADDKETSILRGLETGAVFYIVKPVNFEDLRNIWQYAVGARRVRSAEIRDVSDDPEQDPPDDENPPGEDNGDAPGPEPPVEKAPREDTGAAAGQEPPVEKAPGDHTGDAPGQEPAVERAPAADPAVVVEPALSAKEAKQTKTEENKRAYKRVVVDKGNEKNEVVTSKKSKVVWNTPLHTRFLEAIRRIGLERAVPKKILEVMDTPGLTRENVASHLQKYRIFLKRVAEAGQFDGKNTVERTLRSSFASGNPSLLISALQQGFPESLNQHLIGTILQPGYPGNGMISNIDPSLRAGILPNPQASIGKTRPLPGANGAVRSGAKPRSTQQSSNSVAMLNNILGVRNMGFDGNSVTGNNQNRNFASTDNNVNSGYYPQGAQSSRSASSNPMSLFQQLSDTGTEVDTGYWLESLLNNNAPVENTSPLQFSETDLDMFLRGHANSLRNNEQQVGEGVQNRGYGVSLNSAGHKASENQRFSNQMDSRSDMMGFSDNGVNQLADHFMCLEPRNSNQPNQQQQRGGGAGGGFQGSGPYNANPTWNQGGNNNDGMDSVFGVGLN